MFLNLEFVFSIVGYKMFGVLDKLFLSGSSFIWIHPTCNLIDADQV